MCWVAGDRHGGDDQMETQVDTVFVTGLPPDVTEDDLAGHFGSIGLIKVSVIYIKKM